MPLRREMLLRTVHKGAARVAGLKAKGAQRLAGGAELLAGGEIVVQSLAPRCHDLLVRQDSRLQHVV